MPIYRKAVLGTTEVGVGLGYLIFEGIVGDLSFDIREALEEEAFTLISLPPPVCWAIWSLTTYVPTPTPIVSGLAGNPAKYKFGQISFRSVNATSSYEFWNYQMQTYATKGCIVSPSGYAGIPETIADIPEFEITGQILPGSSAFNGQDNLFNKRSLNQQIPFYGDTAFDIYAEALFEYNAILTYYLAWGDVTVAPGGTYIFNA